MSIYDHEVEDASGQKFKFDKYKNKVLLIVNTASKCGFTNQYDGLEKLHEKYGDDKFSVIAFPCNQFGGQEPGTNDEVQEFCRTTFGVKFPVLGKIEVNGNNAHPLYEELKESAPGLMGSKKIKWNFTKFLVSKDGSSIKRFAPTAKPESLEKEVENLLKES